jgi:hypothetical protein
VGTVELVFRPYDPYYVLFKVREILSEEAP